jgi:hypothetical protein
MNPIDSTWRGKLFNFISLYSAIVSIVFTFMVLYDILYVGDTYFIFDLYLWNYISTSMALVHMVIPLYWIFIWKYIDHMQPPMSALILIHGFALLGAFSHVGDWQYALLNYAYSVAYAEALRYSMRDES